MPKIIECPGCKSRFETDASRNVVRCSNCGVKIERRGASPAVVKKPDPPSNPSSNIRAPRRLQSLARTASPPPESPTPPPQSNSGSADSAPENVDIAIGSNATAAYPPRNKINIWALLATLVLAGISIASLFVIANLLSKPATSETVAESENEDKAKTNPGSPKTDLIAEAQKKTEAKATQKKAPKLPPIDETPEFFSLNEMKEIWKSINGYLVDLEVRSPVRTQHITGVIVDSRGWVVTSRSALQDAGEVQVTLAAKDLETESPFRELVDLSRGIIAEDPAHDLALISINRSQVINLADIGLNTQTNVVEASRWLLARTPPDRHRRWLAECRVDEEGSLEELATEVQEKIETSEIQKDPATNWIVFPPRLPTNLSSELRGSPLLDKEGRIIGLNTGIQTESQSIAVPAAAIKSLMESVDDPSSPQAFPRAAEMLARQSTPENPEVAKANETLDQIVHQLSAQFDTCRKTDWTADNETEFMAMQSLSESISKFMEWQSTPDLTEDDQEKHEARFEELMDEMTMSLEDDLAQQEFLVGKGNEYFSSEVNESSPWFIIGVKVIDDQFNSPQVRGQNSITFQILGTDKKLITLPGTNGRDFRQGRKYILFGKLSPEPPVRSAKFEGDSSIPVVEIPLNFLVTLRSQK